MSAEKKLRRGRLHHPRSKFDMYRTPTVVDIEKTKNKLSLVFSRMFDPGVKLGFMQF